MNTLGSSIICMDHLNFERDVQHAEEIGIDFLHLDVMDGNFVPRYGVYPEIAMRMAEITQMSMDLHLMVSDPEFAIDQFASVKNIEFISVHIEYNEPNILRIVDKIKNKDKKAGLVLNLNTEIRVLEKLLKYSEIDSVMFMGIHPGVLEQNARPHFVIEKAAELQTLCAEHGKLEMVQCDGGVNFSTIPKLKEVGVNNFVCGSSTLYKGVVPGKKWKENRLIIENNYKKLRELLK